MGGIYAKLNEKDEAAHKQADAKKPENPDFDADLVAKIDPRLVEMATAGKKTDAKDRR